MIEIIFIPLQLIVFFLIFSFPFNRFVVKKLKSRIEYNFFNFLVYNILIHLSIYLILSFFRFNLNKIFFIECLIGLLFFGTHFRHVLIKKNKYIKFNYHFILFFFLNIFIFFNIAYNLK